MATPYVTGIIACLLESNPMLAPMEIQSMLHANAISLGYTIFEEGYGLITKDNIHIIDSLPVDYSVSQVTNMNQLTININIQEKISTINYSVYIDSINQPYTNVFTIENEQNDLTNFTLKFKLDNLITGNYTITFILFTDNTFTCMKQSIYLINVTNSTECIPKIVQAGESFICYNRENTSLPALFLFVVPFRSIQIKIGQNTCFTAPSFLFIKQNNITAHIYVISFDLPIHFQKYTIQIQNMNSF